MLGLRFCARAFSSCGERGPLFIAVRGPLTIAASPVVEHRLQTLRLSSCGSQAQPLRGMWDPPRPGLEPASPTLAGRLPTTVPPGKPPKSNIILTLKPDKDSLRSVWKKWQANVTINIEAKILNKKYKQTKSSNEKSNNVSWANWIYHSKERFNIRMPISKICHIRRLKEKIWPSQ